MIFIFPIDIYRNIYTITQTNIKNKIMDNFLFIIFLLVLLVVYFVKTKKYKRLLETIGIYVIANNEETILVWSNDRKIIKLIPDEGFIVPWHNKMILNLSTNHLVVPSGKQVDKNGKTPYVNIVVSYKVIHNYNKVIQNNGLYFSPEFRLENKCGLQMAIKEHFLSTKLDEIDMNEIDNIIKTHFCYEPLSFVSSQLNIIYR